jgi:hypothetical protein
MGAMERPVRDDGRVPGTERFDASASVRAHRFSTPVVRELTPRDMDEQRRMVQASLLPRPRLSATRLASPR